MTRVLMGFTCLLLSACPGAPSEPPPPLRSPEIASAPPHALGALAAGTEAAPKPEVGGLVDPDSLPEAGVPSTEAPPEGSASPPAPPSSTPDAGMAL